MLGGGWWSFQGQVEGASALRLTWGGVGGTVNCVFVFTCNQIMLPF